MRKTLKSNAKSLVKESINKALTPIQQVQRRKLQFSILLINTAKYKLSILFNSELKNEVSEKGIINNQINNDILINKYKIFEEKGNNNTILHKRVNDYYIVLKFNQIKLKMDVKKIMEMKNQQLREIRKNFNFKDKFANILNLELENDPDHKAHKEIDYYKDMGEGDLHLDRENFEIHLINKHSECLKYYCFIQFNEINIAFIKYVKEYEKDEGLFSFKEYQGPEFDTLNPALQQYFVEFLYSLEIYPEIARYVKYLGLNKNKRNYIKFLNDVKNLLV